MDSNNLSFSCPRETPNEIWATLAQRLQRRLFEILNIFPIQMHREANMTLPLKGQMSMYDHYFSNFGRWFMQRFSHKASLVLEKKIFKGFYHIWAWRPSLTIDSNHFSKLSFPWPREALNEIWAILTQSLQRRSHLKFSTFFPYKCIGKQTWPRHKKVKCQCMTINLATLVDLPSQMIYAKNQP